MCARVNVQTTLLRNIATNWLVFAFNIGFMFWTTPLVVGTLGKAQYGVWVIIISLGNYYFLMNAGIVGALKRYTPQLLVDEDWQGLNRQATTTLGFLLSVSALCFVVTGVIAGILPLLFVEDTLSVSVMRWAVLIVGADFCLSLLNLSFLGLLYGAQRYDLASVAQLLGGVARLVLIQILLPRFPYLLTLALLVLCSNQLSHLFTAWCTFREFPHLRFRYRFFSWPVLRQSLSFGVYGLMTDVAARISNTLYPLLIGGFLATTQVAYFSIAESLFLHVGRLISSASGVLMPTISALERQNQRAAIHTIITGVTKYLTLLSLLALLNFFFVGYEFLERWLSPEFARHSWQLLIMLSICSIVLFPQSVALNALSGLGFPNIVNKIAWVETLSMLVGFFVVIPFGGIFAVTLAYSLTRTAVYLYCVPTSICAKIGMSPSRYFASIYVGPLSVLLPVAGLFWALKHYVSLHTWMSLVYTAVPMSSLFCVAAWVYVIAPSDKMFLIAKLKSLLSLGAQPVAPGPSGV